MASHESSVVVFASITFWPFAEPSPSSSSSPKPFKRVPSSRKAFSQWAAQNAHRFGYRPENVQPTTAALQVFAMVCAYESPSSKLHVNVIVEDSIRAARLDIGLRPVDLQLGEVARAFEAQRKVFWHVLHGSNGGFGESSRARDVCGFVGCGGACLPVEHAAVRRSFHLENIFKLSTQRQAALAKARASAASSSPTRRSRNRFSAFVNLPHDVLFRIVLFLKPRDVAALGCTCHYLKTFLEPVIPGLKLRLFPHQSGGLKRMLEMENRTGSDRPMPLLHRFPLSGFPDACVALDQVNGSVVCLTSMPLIQSPRGGLFCDEPGLGKTITALSLILKSLGQVPRPPEGYVCEKIRAESGVEREMKVYRETVEGRFRSFGDTLRERRTRRSVMFPFAEEHQRRSSTRQIRQPDYLATKGEGSVPVIHGVADSVTIYLTHATLIVVPNMLTQHWLNQISAHVTTGGLNVRHLRSVRDLGNSIEELEEMASKCDVILASFEVIGKLYNAMRAETPLLMRLHFLRIIVDEGHTLSGSNISQFANACSRLRAERRWVMTGTPTPSTLRSDVDHLHSLLAFIGEEGYGLDRKAWNVGIREPYSRYKRQSLERLQTILGDVMIRADKSLLQSKCHVSNTILDFDEESAKSYNWLVKLTRRNLLTSDWFSEKHKESLLNGKNMAMAQLTIRNLRLASCCGGTQVAEFNEEDVVCTLDELYERFASIAKVEPGDRFEDPTTQTPLLLIREENEDDDDHQRMAEDVQNRLNMLEDLKRTGTSFMRLTRRLKKPVDGKAWIPRIYSGILHDIGESFLSLSSYCAKCYSFTSIPIVTPCAHLLCEECIISDKNKCPVRSCGARYKHDKNGVPEELIELQPSAHCPDGWKQDLSSIKSVKMDYLLDKIEQLPLNEEWVSGESSPVYTRPKVIIHTQFKDHLLLVAIEMDKREMLKHAYVEMGATNRKEDVVKRRSKKAAEYAQECIKRFAEDPSTFVLLMSTKQGSVGLDLSFVQYIFLLEPVWDASVELQVISRAHRIGSKRDIYVERLVMRDSVEHEMLRDLEEKLGKGVEIRSSSDGKHRGYKDESKVKAILRNLRPVTAKKEGRMPAQGESSGSSHFESLNRKRQLGGHEHQAEARRVRFKAG